MRLSADEKRLIEAAGWPEAKRIPGSLHEAKGKTQAGPPSWEAPLVELFFWFFSFCFFFWGGKGVGGRPCYMFKGVLCSF